MPTPGIAPLPDAPRALGIGASGLFAPDRPERAPPPTRPSPTRFPLQP
jgi:hypothetical protein